MMAEGLTDHVWTLEELLSFRVPPRHLWYNLLVSDGSRAPDGSLSWELLGELPSSRRNLQGIVHFEERFPLRKVRHGRLVFPMTEGLQAFDGRIGTTAEWQFFGAGYPAGVVVRSPLYDLESVQHVSSISWTADESPSTLVELRSRTGNLLDEEYVYYDKNGKQVTEKKYNKFIPNFRGRIDTTRTPGADWSNWSRAYDAPGQAPGPRRYLQLEAHFRSEDPFDTAVLDDIVLEFNNPLAQETRAEIFSAEAQPGEQSLFTYYLHFLLGSIVDTFPQSTASSGSPSRVKWCSCSMRSACRSSCARICCPSPSAVSHKVRDGVPASAD